MLVNALHAALEDREVAFDRVRVLLAIVKANILAAAVVDRAVTRELGANVRVETALVRHQLALATGVLAQDQLDGIGVGVVDVEGAGLAATLHQAHDRTLAGRAALAAPGVRAVSALRRRLGFVLVAEVGLVRLDNLALAAKAARIVRGARHRLADAMRHEPSRLVAKAQHTVELVGAGPLLARGHQVRGQEPLVQRDVRALEDGADRGRELATALPALVQPITVGRAFHLHDPILAAAARAYRA